LREVKAAEAERKVSFPKKSFRRRKKKKNE
jgi:hypothetical protein